jgi:hypothetical protein
MKRDDDALNENAKRFIDLYDNKSNDFRRYFGILIGASLFILMFMPFPFVNTQYMQYNVSKLRDDTSKSIEQVEADLVPYQVVNNSMTYLKNNISSGPQLLRDFISNLSNSDNSNPLDPNSLASLGLEDSISIQQLNQQEPSISAAILEYPECSSLRPPDMPPSSRDNNMTPSMPESWIQCNMHAKVREQFQGYNQTLYEGVVKPLQQLNNTSQEAIGMTELVNDSKRLQQDLDQILIENPTFWHTGGAKGSFFATLDKVVENFWHKYNSQIENQ